MLASGRTGFPLTGVIDLGRFHTIGRYGNQGGRPHKCKATYQIKVQIKVSVLGCSNKRIYINLELIFALVFSRFDFLLYRVKGIVDIYCREQVAGRRLLEYFFGTLEFEICSQ